MDRVILAFPTSHVSACYLCKDPTCGIFFHCGISGTGCARHGRATEDHHERSLRSLCIHCSRAYLLEVVNREIPCHVDGCERTVQIHVGALASTPELSVYNETIRYNVLKWVALHTVKRFCDN